MFSTPNLCEDGRAGFELTRFVGVRDEPHLIARDLIVLGVPR
jgi:hypothetical protein